LSPGYKYTLWNDSFDNQNLKEMELISNLKWRYAVKKYNEELVSEDKIDQIIEAINLTASSCGIQPYRLFIITNPEVRKRLAEGSFNTQIKASSHLVVFAGLNKITSEYIAEYVSMMEEQRNLDSGALVGLKDTLTAYFASQTPEQNAIWSTKQAYIGLGTALIAAAELKVDATPMEGFDPSLFDNVLGLSEKGLHASVIISFGYRDTINDTLASMPKVRLPINEFSNKIK
jgi:nitroreductase/dihydropteridine reductase